MIDSGSLILKKARWYVILAAVVVEFFMGEAAYAAESSIRHLRKWRFLIACLPCLSLTIVIVAASKWPKLTASSDSYSYYEGEKLKAEGEKLRDKNFELENRTYQLEYRLKDHDILIKELVDSKIQQASDIRIINQKMDWIGWLVGGGTLAFLAATFTYFYNLKLRKNLAEAAPWQQNRRKAD